MSDKPSGRWIIEIHGSYYVKEFRFNAKDAAPITIYVPGTFHVSGRFDAKELDNVVLSSMQKAHRTK